jgi:hypothetical protein
MMCGCDAGPRSPGGWNFLAAILLFVVALPLAPSSVSSADGAHAFDLTSTELTILNPDTQQVLGHGHYKVTKVPNGELFQGENRFLNGEYDLEEQRVERAGNGAAPRLISYKHSFFNADGSPESIDALDANAGVLACTHFHGADAPDVRQMKTALPADTYVGSTQLMLLVGRLREGARDLSMHTFICFPGPRVVALNATPSVGSVKWPQYPGNLIKIEMTPDLGWIGALASPFMPRAFGWFDPSDDYNYVGGMFDRFYRYHNLLMVRAPSTPGKTQNSSLLR